jgi:hypothetical protein
MQFTDRKFLEFCDDHHVSVDWSAWLTQRQMPKLNVPIA